MFSVTEHVSLTDFDHEQFFLTSDVIIFYLPPITK